MSEEPLRCPEAGCTGWVSHVEEEGFWGCGECGTTWDQREDLDEDIRYITAKYRYRKKVYKKSKETWKPVPLEKEPDDYEELVEAELEDGTPAEDDFACPVPKCDGTALYMEDESDSGGEPARWQCDCCDSQWFDKQNLFKEIAAMSAQYPYRAKCYRQTADGWKPVEWKGDIMEYVDLVEKEKRVRSKRIRG